MFRPFRNENIQNALSNVCVVLLFYLVFFSINAQANCNSDNIDSFLSAKNIKFIDISTNKSKKWAKNYIKAVESSRNTVLTEYGKILKKYKKRFKAKIRILFGNNLSCIFSAKIRIHGDFNDHLASIPPVTSLDVRLLNGNIDSSTQFKLFIPHTRGGDNEVFATALFKELGFLAPKTYYVPALFNGKEINYLYQEKITKEFIETNGLREAPIIEGDERHMHSRLANKFVLTKVINSKWIKKGTTSLLISQKALNQLNKTYLENLSLEYVYSDPYRLKRPLKANYYNKNAINKEIEFKVLMLAMGANHGLSADDSRFYYDPMYQSFIPIYYDGDIVNIEEIKLKSDHTPSAYEVIKADAAIFLLKNINRKSFKNNLNKLGLDYSIKKVNSIINNIKLNLESIASRSLNNTKNRPYIPYFSNYKEYNDDGRLVFTTTEKLRIEVCNFTLTSCDFETISLEEYSKLLAAKFNNSYIFIGDKQEYISGIIKPKQNEENKFYLGDKVELISYGKAKLLLDRNNRKIEIFQNNINDRILLRGGTLKEWSLKFNGVKNNFDLLKKQRFNHKLLTGCLTFLDMTVNDVEIDINGSSCEDGVNLIRVNGNIKKVVIKNVLSDAFDVDFSKLNFKKIEISSAGNDCIDFSYGSYYIENTVLKNCKDKGISVGENSNLTLNKAKVSETNIGIASKDSSIIKVHDVTNYAVNTCFSAYNKKQEFWGGKIMVKKHNCQPSQVYQQANSLVSLLYEF